MGDIHAAIFIDYTRGGSGVVVSLKVKELNRKMKKIKSAFRFSWGRCLNMNRFLFFLTAFLLFERTTKDNFRGHDVNQKMRRKAARDRPQVTVLGHSVTDNRKNKLETGGLCGS